MVNIDTVYQRVLALANKEQRGYITPQEFNLFANQAQMDIFEQYFYDLNQFKRIPGNDTIYADMVNVLEEKISIFKKGPAKVEYGNSVRTSPSAEATSLIIDPTDPLFGTEVSIISDLYIITDVNLSGKVAEEIRHEDWYKTQNTPLTKATSNRPIWYGKEGKMYWDPKSLGDASVHYIRKPVTVNWNSYTILGAELYDATNSVDFELHPSEETKLVIKILGLAGITLKDPALYQAATAEDNKNIQQEKQ